MPRPSAQPRPPSPLPQQLRRRRRRRCGRAPLMWRRTCSRVGGRLMRSSRNLGASSPRHLCVAPRLTRLLGAPGRLDGRALFPSRPSRLCRWRWSHHHRPQSCLVLRRWHPPQQPPVGALHLPEGGLPAPRPPLRRRPRSGRTRSSLQRLRSPRAVAAAGQWWALTLALRRGGSARRLTRMTSRRTGACGVLVVDIPHLCCHVFDTAAAGLAVGRDGLGELARCASTRSAGLPRGNDEHSSLETPRGQWTRTVCIRNHGAILSRVWLSS
jgi:hypothetical protein